jgi:hypothetical protein
MRYSTLDKDDTWYPVPPYGKGECWTACNDKGEAIAHFEYKEDCIKACEAVNNEHVTYNAKYVEL